MERNQSPAETNERTFWEGSQSPAQVRTFGNATKAPYKQIGEPLGPQEEFCIGKQENLWEGSQSPTQVKTVGDATRAPQRQMREPLGMQEEPCKSKQ
eukprot:12431460-Karenia_brevis.AAC.1